MITDDRLVILSFRGDAGGSYQLDVGWESYFGGRRGRRKCMGPQFL